MPVPGVKLGLANMVTVLAIYLYGLRDGLTVALMRVLLGSLIGGVFLAPGFLPGLAGAVSSTRPAPTAIELRINLQRQNPSTRI